MFVGLQGSGKTTTCTKVSKVLHVYFLLPKTTFTSPEKKDFVFCKISNVSTWLISTKHGFRNMAFCQDCYYSTHSLIVEFPCRCLWAFEAFLSVDLISYICKVVYENKFSWNCLQEFWLNPIMCSLKLNVAWNNIFKGPFVFWKWMNGLLV